MHHPAMTREEMEIGDFIGSSLRVEAPFLPRCAAFVSRPVVTQRAGKGCCKIPLLRRQVVRWPYKGP